MRESLWGYWLVLLGIIIITVMILMQNYTTTNQQDYYLTKEITYASMYDAIDYGYYKKYGELKIVKEKFVENFIRRFAESVSLNQTYTVNFYSIYESPPAVSVEIKTNTGERNIGEESVDLDVNTRLTAILELDANTNNNMVTRVYSSGYFDDGEPVSVSHELKIPTFNLSIDGMEETSRTLKIEEINYVRNFGSNSDLQTYENKYDATFGQPPSLSSCLYSKECRINHYGTLKNVNVEFDGVNVTWSGDVDNTCRSDLNSISDFSGYGDNVCNYGIIYDVKWTWE